MIKFIESFSVSNTSDDDKALGKDETKVKVKNDWNKSFEKDIYIQEAVHVLEDLN
jgi:hypothetical protein